MIAEKDYQTQLENISDRAAAIANQIVTPRPINTRGEIADYVRLTVCGLFVASKSSPMTAERFVSMNSEAQTASEVVHDSVLDYLGHLSLIDRYTYRRHQLINTITEPSRVHAITYGFFHQHLVAGGLESGNENGDAFSIPSSFATLLPGKRGREKRAIRNRLLDENDNRLATTLQTMGTNFGSIFRGFIEVLPEEIKTSAVQKVQTSLDSFKPAS